MGRSVLVSLLGQHLLLLEGICLELGQLRSHTELDSDLGKYQCPVPPMDEGGGRAQKAPGLPLSLSLTPLTCCSHRPAVNTGPTPPAGLV